MTISFKVSENTKEKASDLNLRGELLLYNSFSNATYVAYTYAKEKINVVKWILCPKNIGNTW